MEPVHFDEHGLASLDGVWQFWPGDGERKDLDERRATQITVPGLWEAQGWLELDGVAWYQRHFSVGPIDASLWWTLSFGAVMDITDVWLNDTLIGTHDNAFTPFRLPATEALQAGDNTLTVKVFDPAVHDPEHIRLAHGKQGWANHIFPSRPSLYMTYGGIWQPVRLHRHGPVVIQEVFVNGDPDDLRIDVTLENHSATEVTGVLGVRAVGQVREYEVTIRPASTHRHAVHLGPSQAARWSPDEPHLHAATVDVVVGDRVSDDREVRFGLRTVRVDGTRLLINGAPYRMKSALVQGFGAYRLYAEGTRAEIEEEVGAARAMGFNTLRLHIKAFDPVYLDVCDELGMLLHCDIPVAEPIAHEELGAEGESVVATRSVQAVREQIRRDRNHPSIILWSAMNELGLDRLEARSWERYERFARALVATAKATDGTRPVIENDWVEPDPDRVFAGDVLTAHWYGRLHAEYLDKIERACQRWSHLNRPLFVTEFGDWGLPAMPWLPQPPFWDAREVYATGLAATLWPGSVGRFLNETQRYQGISDRLQLEVFRRHDHIGGYCVTELTDVPQELNGLLDLERSPKRFAAAEMTRANQTVLPMLELDSLVVIAGELITAGLHVASDGDDLSGVAVEVRFGDTAGPVGMEQLLTADTSDRDPTAVVERFNESLWATNVGHLTGHRAHALGPVVIAAPSVPGSHDLVVRLRVGDHLLAENRYTLRVLRPQRAPYPVQLLGDDALTREALARVGAVVGPDGPAVVAEGCLDGPTAAEVDTRLAHGHVVVILAQSDAAAAYYPVPVVLHAVETKWGSSVFHFTTDHGAMPSLPRRNVLVGEDSTVHAHSILTEIQGRRFPETPVVIAYKPVPNAMTGTVVGSHPVGAGRLVFCQYRLCGSASAGDAAARDILSDLLAWASEARAVLQSEESQLADGRRVARYSHSWQVAQ